MTLTDSRQTNQTCVSVQTLHGTDAVLTKKILEEVDLKAGGRLRVVPLLAVLENTPYTFVGTLSIVIHQGRAFLRARIAEVATTGRADGPPVLSEVSGADFDFACSTLESHLRQQASDLLIQAQGIRFWNDDEHIVASLGKELTGKSTDALVTVRGMRYDLERQLIKGNDEKETERLSTSAIVSSLALLGILVGKAADHSRELLREGLWLHATDSASYQAYRKHRDPLLLKTNKLPNVKSRKWMEKHDATIRQCQSLESQLREESRSVRAILTAATTISAANEAEAQKTLNFIVGTASIAIGLPALVFSLYGANILKELKDFSQSLLIPAFAVSAGAGIISALFWWLKSKGLVKKNWWIIPAGFGAVLLIVHLALVLGPYPSPS